MTKNGGEARIIGAWRSGWNLIGRSKTTQEIASYIPLMS